MLWSSDGSAVGTHLLATTTGEIGQRVTVLGEQVVFSTSSEVWVSDATPGGTQMVASLSRSITSRVGALGDGFVFSTGTELWFSDGSSEGTAVIGAVELRADITGANYKTHNGVLYFQGYEPLGGFELWRTDGTFEGTYLVRDINVSGSSHPGNLTVFGGELYFFALDELGRELWKTDGTPLGTTLVRDINPGQGSSTQFNEGIIEWDGQLHFLAQTEDHGPEVWKSDGTAEGTVRVSEISPLSVRSKLIEFGGKLHFFAVEGDALSLWASDGSRDGTVRLGVLAGGQVVQGFTFPFETFNDDLYFETYESFSFGPSYLWRLSPDGSAPRLIFETEMSPVQSLVQFGDSLLFETDMGPVGTEIHAYSPRDDSVTAVEVHPGPRDSHPGRMLVAGNRVLFSATGPYYGTELWGINLTGDFDHDGERGCEDIDMLTGSIIDDVFAEEFDLIRDNVLDMKDVDEWLRVVGAANGEVYRRGDGNLDGAVDVSDFNIWNSNRFSNQGAWCTGDYSVDGVVDVTDFNVWNSHKFATDVVVNISYPTEREYELPNHGARLSLSGAEFQSAQPRYADSPVVDSLDASRHDTELLHNPIRPLIDNGRPQPFSRIKRLDSQVNFREKERNGGIDIAPFDGLPVLDAI